MSPAVFRRRAVQRHLTAIAVAAAVLCIAAVAPARADEPPPFSARAGLALAKDAAATWAADARLVYLENDEPLGQDGAAERWGYLFYSRQRNAARAYSVRDGKIKVASDLGIDLEAPPLPEEWVDSATALTAAEEEAGARYCTEQAGALATMLLLRGAFNPDDPDMTTWAVVYTSPAAPTLFVVVDAGSGKVVRTWKG